MNDSTQAHFTLRIKATATLPGVSVGEDCKRIESGQVQFSEEIVWPIVTKTDKAVLVTTPDGEFWIPKFKLAYSNEPNPVVVATNVLCLVELLKNAAAKRDDALVPVVRADKSRTSKSAGYFVNVWLVQTGPINLKINLPRSLIQEIDGATYAPLWIVLKKGPKDCVPINPKISIQAVLEQIESAALSAKVKAKAAEEDRKKLTESERLARRARIEAKSQKQVNN